MGNDVSQSELSSILADAEEKITQSYPRGENQRAEYFLNGEMVGWRLFGETGGIELEQSCRNGTPHGPTLEWHRSGQLAFATAYVDGLEHGTARQWSEAGTLVGSYEMDHGTGLDLWWHQCQDGARALSEARQYLAGDRHGFEWWLNSDQQHVWRESHFAHGKEHGIQRSWNKAGRLRRGYPQYFINGDQVTKRKYLRAARTDPGLPPFREEDNRPARQFPPEVAAALGPATAMPD